MTKKDSVKTLLGISLVFFMVASIAAIFPGGGGGGGGGSSLPSAVSFTQSSFDIVQVNGDATHDGEIHVTGGTGTIVGDFTGTGGGGDGSGQMKLRTPGGSQTIELDGLNGFAFLDSVIPSVDNNLKLYNHVTTADNGFSIPVDNGCGTDPVIVGNDTNFVVTVGSGVVTSCPLNFGTAWTTHAPVCTIASDTAITAPTVVTTTSAITIGGGATFSGDVIMVHCEGYL